MQIAANNHYSLIPKSASVARKEREGERSKTPMDSMNPRRSIQNYAFDAQGNLYLPIRYEYDISNGNNLLGADCDKYHRITNNRSAEKRYTIIKLPWLSGALLHNTSC